MFQNRQRGVSVFLSNGDRIDNSFLLCTLNQKAGKVVCDIVPKNPVPCVYSSGNKTRLGQDSRTWSPMPYDPRHESRQPLGQDPRTWSPQNANSSKNAPFETPKPIIAQSGWNSYQGIAE